MAQNKGVKRKQINSGAARYGEHRTTFEKNRRRIMATETVCGICGQPVDFNLKPPHPLSPTVDHIIPIAKGGHPSDISNLQLAHWICNREKSDKMLGTGKKYQKAEPKTISNRELPQTMDWRTYRPG